MGEDVFLRLLQMSQKNPSQLKGVFDDCWRQYMSYLSDIAYDIYDSCIEDYYNKYSPKVYDRHGFLEGKNLYQANKISFNDDDIILEIDEYSLWEYKGREKRQRVLDTVMDGIRGGGARTQKWRGWPRDWRTSYPNAYSNPLYSGVWSSNQSTMYGIFNDFLSTAISDTSEYVVNLFYSSI